MKILVSVLTWCVVDNQCMSKRVKASETGQDISQLFTESCWPLLKRGEVQAIGPLPEGHFLWEIAVGLTWHQCESCWWRPDHTTFPQPAVPGQQNWLHHELELVQYEGKQKHNVIYSNLSTAESWRTWVYWQYPSRMRRSSHRNVL